VATILIADDDPIVRDIAGEMLRATAHAAVLAEDGVEVLRLLDVVAVDLLITDMLMPNMDGGEVILAAREKYPDLKILAISGGGAVGVDLMLRTARAFGADATLTKPLQIATFIRTVDQLLQSRPLLRSVAS